MLSERKAQEEMVGFALIMIIVAVIVLIFLSLSLRNQEEEIVENYEVDSFIQSFLMYTSDCADGYQPRYRTIEKLIIDCNKHETCLDKRNTCEVLDSTLGGIVNEAWKVEGDRPVKGYIPQITSGNLVILNLSNGNTTNNYKNSLQKLGKDDIEIIFSAYY